MGNDGVQCWTEEAMLPTQAAVWLSFAFWISACSRAAAEIALVTLSTEPVPTRYVAQGIVNKALYATHHGYTLLVYPRQDEERAPSWSKLVSIRHAINLEKYEWVLWLDGDTLVTNFSTTVESILPTEPHVQFVLGQDCNGVNAGVMLARSSLLALGVLERLYHGAHITKNSVAHPWWEQFSIHQVLAKDAEVQRLTKLVPQNTFNSYHEDVKCLGLDAHHWIPGDFILHMPGISQDRRNELFPSALLNVTV